MHVRSRAVVLLGAALLASACAPPSPAPSSSPAPAPSGGGAADAAAPAMLPVVVEGTSIVVHKPDGTRARRDELVGSMLAVSVDGAPPQLVRIDAIEEDPDDRSGEVLLYTFTAQDASGAWQNVCPPDPGGLQRGFPLAGGWTDTGDHLADDGAIELSCTSGAVGKCIRMGYLPWKGDVDRARHQACTRMLRADYCGDGESHTKNGTLVDIFDPAGIQEPARLEGLTFEAAWGPDGAICVNHTRVPDVTTLEELLRVCPERLRGRTGASCSEESALADPRALVLNASRP